MWKIFKIYSLDDLILPIILFGAKGKKPLAQRIDMSCLPKLGVFR